jgi:pSer/pThr/pTyr-binding forkhead associated (FHA) protein
MTILNDSFLEDLGSTNGTLVNGQPVKKHFLQNNDVVEIGKYKLKYVNEAPATMTQTSSKDHGAARSRRNSSENKGSADRYQDHVRRPRNW